jgi:hypothetical protein
MTAGWLAPASLALLRHPSLWLTAVVQLMRLAPTGWWRRVPFLPLPDEEYLRFRIQTQYGSPDAEPAPADVVAYLKWCRGYNRLAR